MKYNKNFRVSNKRMLTDKFVATCPLDGVAKSKTIKQWIQEHPDLLIKSIWAGKVSVTGDAHKFLMQELNSKFPELIEINSQRKQQHIKNNDHEKWRRSKPGYMLLNPSVLKSRTIK